MNQTSRSSSKWVLALTGVFVAVATAVFTVAIISLRGRSVATLQPTPGVTLDVEDAQPSGLHVSRVIDGDTFSALGLDKIELSIRLAGIDAPELGQKHGYEAKEALKAFLQSEPLVLKDLKKDKYGRYLANVYCSEVWVNREMVSSGNAWCDEVNSFNQDLYDLEQAAKGKHLGLWAATTPISPWRWRAEFK